MSLLTITFLLAQRSETFRSQSRPRSTSAVSSWLTVPDAYKDIFPKLAEIGVLPPDFAQKLVGMAKFRNVLVHLYLEVDLQRVYRYLQENLDDFEIFARHVSEWLQAHTGES